MTQEEYYKKLNEIRGKYADEKKRLAQQYIQSYTNYKKGDIIFDGKQRIRIDIIGLSKDSLYVMDYMNLFFEGPIVTKKGVPFKSGKIARIRECNIKQEEL